MPNKERIELREKAYRMASELAIPGTGHLNILAEEIFQFLTKDEYPDPLKLDEPSPCNGDCGMNYCDENGCIAAKNITETPKPMEIDWSRPQLVATISGLVVKTTGSHSDPHFGGGGCNYRQFLP